MIGSDQALVHGLDRHSTTPLDLIIRLQPVRSRMCGIGERVDRRPIDPPPIVELRPARSDDTTIDSLNMLSPFLFLAAVLVKKDEDDDGSRAAMSLDSHTKMAIGRTVSTLHLLRDLDGLEKAFFVFSDISIRAEGQYRLKMCLFEIAGAAVHFRKSILTDEFTVYSAKKFPGMYQSCALARSFAEQGLKIRIRQESRTRKRTSRHSASSSKENEASPFEFDETSFSVGEFHPLIPGATSDSMDSIQGDHHQMAMQLDEAPWRPSDTVHLGASPFLPKETLSSGQASAALVKGVTHQPHVKNATLFLDEEGNGSRAMRTHNSSSCMTGRRKIDSSVPPHSPHAHTPNRTPSPPLHHHRHGNMKIRSAISDPAWSNASHQTQIVRSDKQDINSNGTQNVSSNTHTLNDYATTSSKQKLALSNLLHPGESTYPQRAPGLSTAGQPIDAMESHVNLDCSSAQTRAPCHTQWFLPPITQQIKMDHVSQYPFESGHSKHPAAGARPDLDKQHTAHGLSNLPSSSGERSDRPEIILNMKPSLASGGYEMTGPKLALPSLREHIRLFDTKPPQEEHQDWNKNN